MQARIEHVAVWVHDLDLMRAFYVKSLGATCGALYENPATGFSSYFVSLGDGARLELMHRPDVGLPPAAATAGFAHVALTLDSREAVDDAVTRLRRQGVPVTSGPRVTGDGYYEAVILDPEGNQIELTCI